jgi:hypothetical protein
MQLKRQPSREENAVENGNEDKGKTCKAVRAGKIKIEYK